MIQSSWLHTRSFRFYLVIRHRYTNGWRWFRDSSVFSKNTVFMCIFYLSNVCHHYLWHHFITSKCFECI